MEFQKKISDMVPGEKIEGFYMLRSASAKTSVSGKLYLAAVLSDSSGDIDAKMWDYTDNGIEREIGGVVKVRGDVSEFKGTYQLTIQKLRPSDETDHYILADLIPVAPIDIDKTVEYVNGVISGMKDPDYRAVSKEMLTRHFDDFVRIPAGKSVHHSFSSGLLMHTSNMLRLAEMISGLYSDIIERDLLLTGTLLHDFAKIQEFVLSPVGLVNDYSIRGQLLGHLVMGAEEVGRICDELKVPENKKMLLQHMILSHHGEPEFGAAIRPHIIESEMLSYIDIIDSRAEIYAEALEQTEPGTFSNRVYALDKKIFNHSSY